MWYSAIIILKCSVGNQTSDFLFDEQVRLINADTVEEAYSKAIRLGQAEENEYYNEAKEKVKWIFEGLFDLDTIDELKDGAEISSKQFRADTSEGLVVTKNQLSVFFIETNNTKTANEIWSGE